MSNDGNEHPDSSDEFPHLSRAPIVEAVIDLRAKAQTPWDVGELKSQLSLRLPDYPGVESRNRFSVSVEIPIVKGTLDSSRPVSTPSAQGWTGYKVSSHDSLQIATFTREGFTFSRLAPYQSWEPFCDEALRLWDVHKDIAGLASIERLGMRFVNRIDMQPGCLDLQDYFEKFESPSIGLLTSGFLHHDVLTVPNSIYAINVIRTIQPAGTDQGGFALFFDIDVSTTERIAPDDAEVRHRLHEMRTWKNRIFFAGVTRKMVDLWR